MFFFLIFSIPDAFYFWGMCWRYKRLANFLFPFSEYQGSSVVTGFSINYDILICYFLESIICVVESLNYALELLSSVIKISLLTES